MSFRDVKAYFKARLVTVDPKLREHLDGFNQENIPNNLLDKSWHLLDETTGRISQSQTCLLVNYPISLSVWLKGYKNPVGALDTARDLSEAIIKECLKHSNRATQPIIKNILFETMELSPLAQSNDNTIKITLRFIALVGV